jgi:hypothetical protein
LSSIRSPQIRSLVRNKHQGLGRMQTLSLETDRRERI